MNRRTKRALSIVFAFAITLSLLSVPVFGEINSSAYIAAFGANLSQGSSAGKLDVSYSITGKGQMDSIGVLWINVYRSSGILYTVIAGSTANGLVLNNSVTAMGTYTVNCTAGNSYYCEVTLFASKDGGGDSRTVQTTPVVAPTSP